MKKAMFLALFVILALVAPLGAQQEGSVAIAGEITPSAENIVPDGVTCLADAAKVLAPEKAAKYCENLAKLTAKTSTRVANEAADATKASRPLVITSGYGYGGGYSRSYSYRRPVVVYSAPQRRSSARVAPQAKPRPAAVSRPVARNGAPSVRRVSAPTRRSGSRSR
jgi:hypothetical protein